MKESKSYYFKKSFNYKYYSACIIKALHALYCSSLSFISGWLNEEQNYIRKDYTWYDIVEYDVQNKVYRQVFSNYCTLLTSQKIILVSTLIFPFYFDREKSWISM
jgi:hypothetical protein